MTMIRRILGIIFVSLLWITTGCSDEPEFDYGDFCEVFATYEGAEQGNATFSYCRYNDSPLLTLTAENVASLDVDKGERLFIRYTDLGSNGDENQRKIRLDGYSEIISDVVRSATADQMQGYTSTEIDVTSLWRSGTYLNLNSWVPYSGKRFLMMLVVDNATLDSETVEAEIIYDLLGETPTFERKAYASFDIANLWNRETFRQLRVKVNDPTGDTYYEFIKIKL